MQGEREGGKKKKTYHHNRSKREEIVGTTQHRIGGHVLPPSCGQGTHLTFTSKASICCIASKCKCCRAFRDVHSCDPSEKKIYVFFCFPYSL